MIELIWNILFVTIIILFIQSDKKKSEHVTAAELSWHVQNLERTDPVINLQERAASIVTTIVDSRPHTHNNGKSTWSVSVTWPTRKYGHVEDTFVTDCVGRYQMETFSALLDLCAGDSAITGEFPWQRPATQSCDVFFDLRLNKRSSKKSGHRWFVTLHISLLSEIIPAVDETESCHPSTA